jgi:hypothetical protein
LYDANGRRLKDCAGPADAFAMNVETKIKLLEWALADTKQAINDGRLTDARRHLRYVSLEAEDAAHGLNATISETVLDKR